jgi:hypothetical protein
MRTTSSLKVRISFNTSWLCAPPCVPFLPLPGSMAGMSDLAYWLASGIFCFTLSFLTTLMLYGFAFLFSVATYVALPL